MRQQINEEVSVVLYYSAEKREALPWRISWRNKDYPVVPAQPGHQQPALDTGGHP